MVNEVEPAEAAKAGLNKLPTNVEAATAELVWSNLRLVNLFCILTSPYMMNLNKHWVIVLASDILHSFAIFYQTKFTSPL